MSFEGSIKEWVSVDNRIKSLSDRMRNLRAEKGELGDRIMQYAQTNNLSNAVVKISDGCLRFATTRHLAPLTAKHVEECLLQCIGDQSQVTAIMKYIKDTRAVKETQDIKRTYTKE
jgi:hypothetical protein